LILRSPAARFCTPHFDAMLVGVRKTVAKRKAVLKSQSAVVKRVMGKVNKAGELSKLGKTSKASVCPPSLKGISAVAINLARREDRWRKVQKSVAKQAPWLKFTRLDAVDGKAAPPPEKEVCKRYSTARLAELFFWYKPMMVSMSPGERGCCGSHVKAWRLAASGTKPLLVLEDDAVALKTFTSSLAKAVAEAPRGTGMIFLSSKDRGTTKPFGKVLMTPDFVWTTVGYVIWPATARALLKMLPMDMPVDNFLGWHIKQGTIKAFSLRPAAVRQAQTWNVGSDINHSDDVAHR